MIPGWIQEIARERHQALLAGAERDRLGRLVRGKKAPRPRHSYAARVSGAGAQSPSAGATSKLNAAKSKERTPVTPTGDPRLSSMRRRMISTVLALAALSAATAGSVMAAGDGARATVTVKSSSYGRILFDGRGFVLYGFTRDPRGRSACTGACATAWPPYIVKSRPRAGAGVNPARVGTIKRADGSLQATYAGRPLYYYIGDKQPGQILCQNVTEFGGVWRVVRPTGRLVG
jgi:predicted lipoprotein with Yx(FWY)xxD motif